MYTVKTRGFRVRSYANSDSPGTIHTEPSLSKTLNCHGQPSQPPQPSPTSETALPGIDLDRGRVDAVLRHARGACELLKSVPPELDHCGIVDRDHVHGRLVVVLQLPARAALRRAVDCRGDVSEFSACLQG